MYKLSLALGTLSVLVTAQNSTNIPGLITSDTYFYGDSPPVYPAPIASGTGDWAAAYVKAKAFVSQLTLEEKQNLTFGITSTTNGCSGNIQAIERLDFPGLCLNDAGNGVRGTDFVNGYPSGVSVGASWNRQLTHDRSYYMVSFSETGLSATSLTMLVTGRRVQNQGSQCCSWSCCWTTRQDCRGRQELVC